MGCASSSPLVTQGKNLIENAKESASEFATKGEHVMHDVGDTAKDGFNTGVGHVKDAMSSAYETAENSIGTMVGKIGDTFTGAKSDVKEGVHGLENATEETAKKTKENMVEAVSQAETVLASEAEHAEEMISHAIDDAEEAVEKRTDTIHEAAHTTGEKIFEKAETIRSNAEKEIEKLRDTSLEIEDMEQSLDVIENDISETEKKVEGVVHRLPTPAPSPPPEVEAKKEESPTFWEARADAILEQRMKSIDIDLPPPKSEPVNDHDDVIGAANHVENDLEVEDLELATERPRAEDHLGEALENTEKRSVNSFILSDK